MPREFGDEVHETTPEASFGAGKEAGEHLHETELVKESGDEYPQESTKNPDNRYTP